MAEEKQPFSVFPKKVICVAVQSLWPWPRAKGNTQRKESDGAQEIREKKHLSEVKA